MSNKKTIKQLRKEAVASINKNINNIDSRSIVSDYDIVSLLTSYVIKKYLQSH